MKFKTNFFAGEGNKTKETIRSNGVKMTIRANRMRFFYPDEWKAFYDALTNKQKITFNFLINTGARINEVKNIRLQDIDFDRGLIIIRWTKARNEDGSRKMRVIPVSSQFIKWIKKIVEEHKMKMDSQFPILSRFAGNIAMKKALQKINIPDYKMFSIHNVRKTLETWLISLDIDSMKISKHFGHSVMVASRFYVSPDTFSYEDKMAVREIIGDLYAPQRF